VQGYLTGGVVSVADAAGRGALGWHWLGWAVSLQGGVQACAARGLLEGHECPVARGRTRWSSSHVTAQVFDGGGGGLTGERAGVAAPVGCWCGVESMCLNESEWERAWGRERGRVQSDMHGAGWGWLGGGGAREREWACLWTKRDAEREMCVLVWSGGQRGGVEVEVVCLGLC
jgi:hypothetical protein